MVGTNLSCSFVYGAGVDKSSRYCAYLRLTVGKKTSSHTASTIRIVL